MEYTREYLREIAVQTCLPMMQKAAKEWANHRHGNCIDKAGYVATELEGICRPFIGIASVLYDTGDSGDRQQLVIKIGNRVVPVQTWLKETLLEGLCEDSPYRFERGRASVGDQLFYNQAVTEISLLCVALYFTREVIWDRWEHSEQDSLAAHFITWSEKALEDSWPNNHLWFPILAMTALHKMGYEIPDYQEKVQNTLRKLDDMYIGKGWYQDGEFGRFDYYMAWSLHAYPLLWTLMEDASFTDFKKRRQEYLRRTEEFLPFYMHLFDTTGANVLYGRSLSYRFAAAAIFPLAAMAGCQFDYGAGKRILFQNIRYYLSDGKTDDRILAPGIMYSNQMVVEDYISDGAPYWCAKAFLALLMPAEHPFWQSKKSKMPVEQGDFLIVPEVPRIHWVVEGNRDISGITLYNNVSQYYQNQHLEHHQNDMGAFYGKFAYNSRCAFATSSRDILAFDNMISLMTEDKTLCSHRIGFTDLGENAGVYYSCHTPFANDPGTRIISALIPLRAGRHIRVHRVILSQPYIVREGGFSLPFADDNYRERTEKRKNGILYSVHMPGMTSGILYFGKVPVQVRLERVKPGCHLLSPLAGYPSYLTEQLPAGTYDFATLFGISCREGNALLDRQTEIHYHYDPVQSVVEMGNEAWKIRWK